MHKVTVLQKDLFDQKGNFNVGLSRLISKSPSCKAASCLSKAPSVQSKLALQV